MPGPELNSGDAELRSLLHARWGSHIAELVLHHQIAKDSTPSSATLEAERRCRKPAVAKPAKARFAGPSNQESAGHSEGLRR